jgi:probable HAF family extracellular repeat protein
MHAWRMLSSTIAVGLLLTGCSKQMSTQPIPVRVVADAPASTGTSVAAGSYALRDLGVLPGGTFSSALALSPTGLIAGSASKSDGTYGPILWNAGALKSLGSLGGTYGSASGVNNSGVVVGTSYLASGGWHAFCYTNNSMKDLGKLSGFNSGAVGVTAGGLVIGSGDLYGGWTRGFTWQVGSTGALKQLSTLGGKSCWACAVNDAGLIVGQSNTSGPDPYSAGGPLHACSWSNGVIHDLGTLGGASGTSQATAVSSNGLIAGWTTSPAGNHACVFSGGTITDLGALPGLKSTRATAINASGTVIGLATNSKYGGNSTRGFLYRNGTIANIQDKISNLGGWTITQLNAINDAGAIVGVGIVPASVGYGTHAILLTPQ